MYFFIVKTLLFYYEKPKNTDEVQESLFNIRDNIDGKNEMVINRTVEEYFEKPLKGFDKWLEDNNKQTMKKVYLFLFHLISVGQRILIQICSAPDSYNW